MGKKDELKVKRCTDNWNCSSPLHDEFGWISLKSLCFVYVLHIHAARQEKWHFSEKIERLKLRYLLRSSMGVSCLRPIFSWMHYVVTLRSGNPPHLSSFTFGFYSKFTFLIPYRSRVSHSLRIARSNLASKVTFFLITDSLLVQYKNECTHPSLRNSV